MFIFNRQNILLSFPFRYEGSYGSGSGQSSYHSGWGANNYQSYPNYYNSPSNTSPQTPYLNPTPSVVLYPHLYSTVNQNQIHLHLHGEKAAESLQCSGEELAATIVANSNNLTISSGTRSSIEIGIVHNSQGGMMNEEERYTHADRQGDQSVWRPYWYGWWKNVENDTRKKQAGKKSESVFRSTERKKCCLRPFYLIWV